MCSCPGCTKRERAPEHAPATLVHQIDWIPVKVWKLGKASYSILVSSTANQHVAYIVTSLLSTYDISNESTGKVLIRN